MGLIREVVTGGPDALVARASELCEQRIAAGGGRRLERRRRTRYEPVSDRVGQLCARHESMHVSVCTLPHYVSAYHLRPSPHLHGPVNRFDAAEKHRLLTINAEESAELANAFVSSKFLTAMARFNKGRNKSKEAFFFSAANTLLPLWQPSPVEPRLPAKL